MYEYEFLGEKFESENEYLTDFFEVIEEYWGYGQAAADKGDVEECEAFLNKVIGAVEVAYWTKIIEEVDRYRIRRFFRELRDSCENNKAE